MTEDDVRAIAGKTIQSVDLTDGDYDYDRRTPDYYLYLRFTDGSRMALPIDIPEDPLYFSTEQMQEAIGYFSPDEIAERLKRDAESKRLSEEGERQRKEYVYWQLKKELGIK